MKFYSDLKQKINGILFRFIVFLLKKYKTSFAIGNNFKSFGIPTIRMDKNSRFIIGNNVVLRNNTNNNMVGLYKKCSFAVSEGAKLVIGDNCGFSGVSIFCSTEIKIGNNVNFGGNVCVWDTDFHPICYKARRINDQKRIKRIPISIGDDVFIGANSIILKGTTIGDRSIIGAGSVVVNDVPNDEIWAGNPARFIRKIVDGR